MATGDELVDVSAPVRDWEIRRSNEYALTGALLSRGFNCIERSVVPDDLAETIVALREQLSRHDVLILSGGVSMGAFDHVPKALSKIGVERVFHKVAQRPGKPLWFGVGPEGSVCLVCRAIRCLPRPVACVMSCLCFWRGRAVPP